MSLNTLSKIDYILGFTRKDDNFSPTLSESITHGMNNKSGKFKRNGIHDRWMKVLNMIKLLQKYSMSWNKNVKN